VLANNINQRNEDLAFFEIGKVFWLDGELNSTDLAIERYNLGVVLRGKTVSNWNSTASEYDFYYLKSLMEEMFDVFRLEQRVYVPCKDNPTYHPGRTAEIYISGKKVGVIGELHPEVVENYGMKSRIYAGEIDIEELFALGCGRLSVSRLPKFPSTGRDMAVVVDKDVPAVELLEVIKANGSTLLQDAQIFDVYQGEQIAEGKKS